jgi:hypothetical protein
MKLTIHLKLLQSAGIWIYTSTTPDSLHGIVLNSSYTHLSLQLD